MPRSLLAFSFLLFALSGQAQTLLYEDVFNGGVSGAGYSPGVDGISPGLFDVAIPAGSSIHRAYLMASRHGPALDKTVTLNGIPYTFSNANVVSDPFLSPIYGGASGVHAIDVTANIDPTMLAYTMVVPSAGGTSNRFADYYLWIAYDNPSLEPVHASIWINNVDLQAIMPFTIAPSAPFDTSCHTIAVASFNGYQCFVGTDGELVYVDGTFAGEMGGPDFNSGLCGGPMGNFGFFNNTCTGLGDDTNDAVVGGPDALMVVNDYIGGSPFLLEFEHNPGAANLEDNAVWAVFVTAGAGVDTGALFVDAGPDQTICAGESVVLNGSSSGLLSWSPTFGLSDPSSPTPTASPLVSTTYILQASLGCGVVYDTVLVLVDDPELPPPTAVQICQGDSILLGRAPMPGFTYSWSPATGLDDSGAANPIASPQADIVYTLTGTSPNGCIASSTVSVSVSVPMVDAGPDRFFLPGSSTPLLASGTLLTYSWSPADVLSCTPCPDPLASPVTTTTFVVSGLDANGCRASDSVTLFVGAECVDGPFLPSAFSPNGDGINDAFSPLGGALQEGRLTVFNRWGEAVFDGPVPGIGWNGSHRGRSAETGVYAYVLRGTCLDGEALREAGTVTLLR